MMRFGAITLALVAAQAEAHSYISKPQATFPDGFYQPMSPFARIDGESFPGAASVASYMGPEKIAAAMKSTNAISLRQFIMKNMNVTMDPSTMSPASDAKPTKECGMSLPTGTRQELPATIEWQWAHPGPCEIWCDNTRLFFNDNCAGNSVGNPKIDTSKCKGASLLQGMYVGTHVPNWEVYANCVPLTSGTKTDAASLFNANAPVDGSSTGGETGSDADDDDDDTGATPTPSTTKPASSSAAPSPSTSPAPTTTAPTTPTPTPSSTTKPVCKKRRNRN
ncbi:hypothetical protein Poli38472_001970 [Pythium oligandrum]|uniref:Uncharacterized protein n=1 Tax=Pythium oligandrum TaxID=41045 RepID=A0A8K1CV47_PYTOL|nr:hypothetical protein Poli38472_001970 [Pythium oligandrum]|eukprot:TMW69814.1 hypothetical protein Poli38472_001970 [Pythium oligandrum]